MASPNSSPAPSPPPSPSPPSPHILHHLQTLPQIMRNFPRKSALLPLHLPQTILSLRERRNRIPGLVRPVNSLRAPVTTSTVTRRKMKSPAAPRRLRTRATRSPPRRRPPVRLKMTRKMMMKMMMRNRIA